MSAVTAPQSRLAPPNTQTHDDAANTSLGTNNPFRRTTSPDLSARRSPLPSADQARPMSRNPFLDPQAGVNNGAPRSGQDADAVKLADDIFKSNTQPTRLPPNPNGLSSQAPPAGPPPNRGPPPPSAHRPSRSGEVRDAQRLPRPRPADGDRPTQGSPDKPRMRRNSESSLRDKDKSEDERRRRERRRERDARREKDGKPQDPKDPKQRTARKQRGLDVIDKLDVTGIYGQGLFHHDGPFDACNPHRNRKNLTHAPMQAFPVDSANNALGGGGAPRQFNYDRFHGRGEEGFTDFASTGQDYTTDPAKRQRQMNDKMAQLINPTDRAPQIHGEESYGLGTSTFLEGAPASKSAMQRRESDHDVPQVETSGGGLQRKKSLAMRIRGMSQPRRPTDLPGGRIMGLEGNGPRSPSPPSIAQSAGGPSRARPMNKEQNPFFENTHDDAYDRKGARIQASEISNAARGQRSASPMGAPPLTRAITNDTAMRSSFERDGKSGGGFINRMKSLKAGPRRARPDVTG